MTAEQLGIPTLDLAMQATALAVPVTKWGTIARSAPMPGTYHFFTRDHQFASLLKRPMVLVDSGCQVAVEPNFSTVAGMPLAEVLAGIYRKRALAREWQLAGVRILVDLSVDPEFREANLLGVPPGWSAFAARCHRGIGPEVLDADHAAARAIAGGEPALFAVFGGGKRGRALCVARGWVHIPEHRHVVAGREAAYGQG